MNAVLLVEGATDQQFYQALFRKMGVEIKVSPPSDHNLKDTVSVFPIIIPFLIKQLEAGRLDQLGIIADADHVSGGGFDNRWRDLTHCFKQSGYRVPEKPPALPHRGSMFKHDQLPPVGLFLMPCHQDNGIFEELLFSSLREEQRPLADHAIKVVERLPVRLFSNYHLPKAYLHSLLAWQKRPGQTLDILVNADMLDYETLHLKGFLEWLGQVFPSIGSDQKGRLSPQA